MKRFGRVLLLCTAGLAIASAWGLAYVRISREWRKSQPKAWASYEKAVTLLEEGKIMEVEPSLLEAIALSQREEPEFFRALGTHYFYTHRCHEALDRFRAALRLRPSLEPAVIKSMAWCLAETGSTREAIRTLEHIQTAFGDTFTSSDAEFLRALRHQTAISGQSALRPVTVLVELKKPRPPGSLHLVGNFNKDGGLSDAYGYSGLPLERVSGLLYRSELKLRPDADLPFLFLLKESDGRILASASLQLTPRAFSGAVLRLAERTELEWSMLKERSVVRSRRPGADGVHRTFVFFPDGGSWWIVRNLVERGLMPNTAAMLARGARAEMISDPPITSIAIQRLTSFESRPSFWDTVLLQLKGLPMLDRFVGRPAQNRETLAGRFAKAGVSYVDLTFNQAYVRSGSDQSEEAGVEREAHFRYNFDPTDFEVGPGSVLRKFVDLERVPGFVQRRNLYGQWLLATQWDDTERKFGLGLSMFTSKSRPQVLLIRLPALDIISHYFFVPEGGLNERLMLLNAFYVYLDDCVGRIQETLDQDDVMLLISDHGFLSLYQHHPVALFIQDDPASPRPREIRPFLIQEFPARLSDAVRNQ